MKISPFAPILSLAAALLICSSLLLSAAEAPTGQQSKLRHVVAFKFKDTATSEQIKKVETAFAALPKKISQIKQFEWGMNNSPEKLNKGCTHGFILTFDSEKARDIYLEHPTHKEFGALVGPLLADVFVIDFWAKE